MKTRHGNGGGKGRWYIVIGVIVIGLVLVAWFALNGSGTSHVTTTGTPKRIILYVNQGNGVVNITNFGTMADFAIAQGFNTVFFQVYRQGVLKFSPQDLQTFVTEAHQRNLSIFFALYLTNSSQQIPDSIYGYGENGVSLDMSTLSLSAQQSLLSSLKAHYGGETAVTTSDMQSTLKPDLLVLETYYASEQSFIRHGVIGSVGVFETSSKAEYQTEFQYALQKSDGVMVFDYAGLLKSGY